MKKTVLTAVAFTAVGVTGLIVGMKAAWKGMGA